MTTVKGPEAGSLPASVISFEKAVVGRRGSSSQNLGQNPGGEGFALITPFEALEVTALERIPPAEFLDGLTMVAVRKELYWCAELEENMPKLKAIESIEDLLAQAKLGITTGIFGLTPDSKREIQSVFGKIGFTPEEVNIFNIKRAAAEGIDDYLPSWTTHAVKQRLAEDKEYASEIGSQAGGWYLILMGEKGENEYESQEAWKDALDLVIETEAYALLERTLGSLRRCLLQDKKLQFNNPRTQAKRLKPLNEEELLSGLNEVASELEKAA